MKWIKRIIRAIEVSLFEVMAFQLRTFKEALHYQIPPHTNTTTLDEAAGADQPSLGAIGPRAL